MEFYNEQMEYFREFKLRANSVYTDIIYLKLDTYRMNEKLSVIRRIDELLLYEFHLSFSTHKLVNLSEETFIIITIKENEVENSEAYANETRG